MPTNVSVTIVTLTPLPHATAPLKIPTEKQTLFEGNAAYSCQVHASLFEGLNVASFDSRFAIINVDGGAHTPPRFGAARRFIERCSILHASTVNAPR